MKEEQLQIVRKWFLQKASEVVEARAREVEKRIEEIKSGVALKKAEMELAAIRVSDLKEVARNGFDDLCPRDVPEEVLAYLGILNKEIHFNVGDDSGNRGLRLEVRQGSIEWDRVPDPWADETREKWAKEAGQIRQLASGVTFSGQETSGKK